MKEPYCNRFDEFLVDLSEGREEMCPCAGHDIENCYDGYCQSFAWKERTEVMK